MPHPLDAAGMALVAAILPLRIDCRKKSCSAISAAIVTACRKQRRLDRIPNAADQDCTIWLVEIADHVGPPPDDHPPGADRWGVLGPAKEQWCGAQKCSLH
jgi:hypothetical protein